MKRGSANISMLEVQGEEFGIVFALDIYAYQW